ncbi:decaprenyl-phosphate phosphoribosyltransferase [Haliangium sp. UPWRP_2]|uniref:decaprenyl-phosphate phosphoribosyltransferase n=1 Tax=Haliangium sp. UPWRP_2 TaxID=1931276 RepID=UPI0018EE030B|nr:decaprenyl-phosphate phosphoribosyltransferase [Haliangium sp. UPWRP_2]
MKQLQSVHDRRLLCPVMATVWHLFRALRPKQWSKNLLLYGSFLFNLNKLWQPWSAQMWAYLLQATLGMLVFCALSSGVYLLNDARDVEADRRHPQKRHRPLASGALPAWLAVVTAIVLLLGSLLAAVRLSQPFAASLAIYLAMQVLYTLWWKHVVILDVFVIASGFVLRAVAGALVISSWISPWLYIVTFLGALFLGLCKRRHELLLLDAEAAAHRKILAEYTPQLLDQMIGVTTASTIMAYSLYTFTADGLPRNHAMMATIPFVLYGLFRYLYLTYRHDQGGSPEEILLRDRPLNVVIGLWLVTAALVLGIGR